MSASANETPDILRDTEYNKGPQEIHASGSGLTTVIEPCEIVDQTKIITISSNSTVQAPYRTYTMTYRQTKFQDLTHNQYHMPVSTSMDYEMTYMVKTIMSLAVY
jgi:hypothetical protein